MPSPAIENIALTGRHSTKAFTVSHRCVAHRSAAAQLPVLPERIRSGLTCCPCGSKSAHPGDPHLRGGKSAHRSGLAAEYADLLTGFSHNGILERQRLRRIGSGLGSRSVMLPGLAQLDETIIDKFEAAGLKLFRNRVTTLRLWLQLWDAQTGHILWESAREITVSTVLLSPSRAVPLGETIQKLLFNMIQDGLLRGKTKTEYYFD